MQLTRALVQLPLRADAERLAAEVDSIDESYWRPHPSGIPGNDALPLVSREGVPDDDAAEGPMRPTPHLERLPYVQHVIGALGTVVGRTRLMRLRSESEATSHVDIHHYWLERLRVHVPIVTHPDVEFIVGDEVGHMGPGETWVFDTWSLHAVRNPADAPRIHLVVDTVGTASLWELIDNSSAPARLVEGSGHPPELEFETVNRPVVMSPWEMERLFARLLSGCPEEELVGLSKELTRVTRDWRGLWALYGDAPDGQPQFAARAREARQQLEPWVGQVTLPNGLDAATTVRNSVLEAAVVATPHSASSSLSARPPTSGLAVGSSAPRIVEPVLIVSPPRSGSTLLFETLAESPTAWTIKRESHAVIETIPGLHPRDRDWESNQLRADDATPDRVTAIHTRFAMQAVDRENRRPAGDQPIRLLEKTPKNALRIPFLAAAFPDSQFVMLYRDPLDAIASMLAGWRSGKFVTYPELPGWSGPSWSFALFPGWRDLAGKPLIEVVAEQWRQVMTILLDDLEQLPTDQWVVAGYGPLVREPQAEVERLCRALELDWDRSLTTPLPLSSTTLTPPDATKTEAVSDELATIADVVAETAERARDAFAKPPGPSRTRNRSHLSLADTNSPAPAASQRATSPAASGAGFTSEATASFVELLESARSSVLVSTYQSKRLIVLRALDGAINTHFLAFESPMGIAAKGPDLALAAGRAIWRFRDRPAMLARLEPAGRHDSCFVPRSAHLTGNVRSHDVAYGDDELWLVATLFSCLATIDEEHSFVPRWRPPFISALAAEDRCHLNGLAMVDGQPGFVTCFGATDHRGAWREEGSATRNGMIIHVPSSETVATGLCMPHSPRWHNGRLWILESGRGTLCVVDPAKGKVETVAKLPGFTRGLTFLGPYALVGLSLVRETVFDGVPIKDTERSCGVWAVDTRSGRVAGWLRFSGIVQELYDVQALPGRRFATILEPEDDLTERCFVVPDEALADVPK